MCDEFVCSSMEIVVILSLRSAELEDDNMIEKASALLGGLESDARKRGEKRNVKGSRRKGTMIQEQEEPGRLWEDGEGLEFEEISDVSHVAFGAMRSSEGIGDSLARIGVAAMGAFTELVAGPRGEQLPLLV